MRVAAAGATYVFNQAGHAIDLEGLVGLDDADGPCANAVKDPQRTKTNGDTRQILAIVWGTSALPRRAAQTAAWLGELLGTSGATVASVSV